jgi:hypothetical protein
MRHSLMLDLAVVDDGGGSVSVVVTTLANKDPLQVYAACPFTGSTNSAARYAPNLRVPNLQSLQFSQ